MSRNLAIKHIRTTKTNLDLQSASGGLNEGEIYLITDESRLAIGLSSTTYETFAKESEAGGGGTDISDADAAVGDVLSGKTFYAGSEPKKTGTMPDNGTVSTDITTVSQEVTIAAGKHSGSGVVKISATEQAKIIAGNIASGVTILGVAGSAEAASNPTTGLLGWGVISSGYIFLSYPVTFFNEDNNWDAISGGTNHFLAIKDGYLYSWGSGQNYKLGTGSTINTKTPTQVGSYNDWWKVSAGDNHSYGIRKTWNGSGYDYTLWVWGYNVYGQLGDSSIGMYGTTPTQIGTDTDWTDCSAGYQWGCAVKGGKLYTCGYNTSYKTGQAASSGYTTEWTSYDSSTGWTDCAAGYQHGLGIKSGYLYAWGDSANYRTGNGNTTDLQVPTQIGSSSDWSKISAGQEHSAAINTSGELFTWGEGGSGRLGSGGISDVSTPTQIGTDTDWEYVTCNGNSSSYGSDITAAIKGGAIYITGLNEGFIPGSTNSYETTFQNVIDATNCTDIGITQYEIFAIRRT